MTYLVEWMVTMTPRCLYAQRLFAWRGSWGAEVFEARGCADLYNEACKRVETKRIENEKREAERARKARERNVKKAALAKLTPEERKVLGL